MLGFFKNLFKMFEKNEKVSEKTETVQEIAVKLVQEQLKVLQVENGPKERTIFMVGSKAVGKSTVINKFFDREENSRPTLALEYSFGRRTSGNQKQVLNMWELGSLDNSEQLIEVPLLTHGIEHFAAIIMLDLSQTQRVWLELASVYKSLRNTCEQILRAHPEQQQFYYERSAERVKKEHVDIEHLELMPFPIIIVGGKYDLFMDLDPELKKHVCRCLRSMAHLIGASLLFYSSKIPKLAKTLRDTISHLGFGSPANPFRVHTTDYNDALSIWFGTDSWECIGNVGALNVERIGIQLAVDVPQFQTMVAKEKSPPADPAKDAGFRESIIDEMHAQKDEELQTIIRDSQLRGQFESVAA